MHRISGSLYFPQVEGLGTTYEAYITSEFLDRFIKEQAVQTVCEYPMCTFRVPGAIGAMLARKGCDVSLATTDEDALRKAEALCTEYGVRRNVQFSRIGFDRLQSNSFDLVFHISVLPTMTRDLGMDPFECISEMSRISRRYVIITNHNLSYSVLLDRMLSFMMRKPSQFGETYLVGVIPVRHMLRRLGLEIQEEFTFDMPPWMATDLSRAVPTIRAYGIRGLAGCNATTIDSIMRKYAFIERSSLPRFLKALHAHHVALIAEKPTRDSP